MPKPILNLADVEFRKVGHGTNVPGAENAPEKFSAQVGDIGRRIGAQKLGYNLTVVPSGKRYAFAYPASPATAVGWNLCNLSDTVTEIVVGLPSESSTSAGASRA